MSKNKVARGAKAKPQQIQELQHEVSLAVWDLVSPVEMGKLVSLKAGVKCKAGCNLAGGSVVVDDSEGAALAGGKLGGVPAAATSALYWTEMQFLSPPTQGLRRWTVRFEGSHEPTFHPRAEINVGVLLVRPALCRIAIAVADEATKAPLENAYVRVGESTMFTDGSGKAIASVPAGIKELVVWKRDHKMTRQKIEVAKDAVVQVNLTPYPCKYCPDRTG